jgi:hypothetical protein
MFRDLALLLLTLVYDLLYNLKMQTEVPGGGQNARPPHLRAVGPPGASVRPTVRIRPVVPVRIESRPDGFEPSDPYVRRFWVAAIGSSAVAELLRLVRAAEKGEGVRLPRSLPLLLRVGLVRAETAGLIVFDRVPAVPSELRWRFPPSLGEEHTSWIRSSRVQ